MLYPQGNFYPQGAFSPQSFSPQGSFYPQGTFGPQSFSPQGSFYPQGTFGPQAFQSSPFQSNLSNIPFANTLYGYSQQTPTFAQSAPQLSNWQHPAQQQAALQQAALQQHAMQQLLAHQLAAQQLATQQPSAMNAFTGLSSGTPQSMGAQSIGAWPQQQPNPEQFNPALTPRHHLLQQLAQYHYLVAQQLAQLAAQQAVQSATTPYAGQFIPYAGQFIPGAGQFIPGQLGGNFASGSTMH
jgi:hypothetical protein